MELLIIISVTLLIAAIVFVGGYYIRKSGLLEKYLTKDNIELFEKLLKISELIINKYAAEQVQSKYELVKTIALEVVEYIEVIATYDNNEDKRDYALETIIFVLEEFGHQIDETDKQFIENIINKMVVLLPETYKEK